MSAFEFLGEIARRMGKLALPGLAALAILIWGVAHSFAKPGERVSVLFGLVEYTKEGPAAKDSTARRLQADSAGQAPSLDTVLTLAGLSGRSTRWDVLGKLGRPSKVDTLKEGIVRLRFFPLEEPYWGMDYAIMADIGTDDSLKSLAVVTRYGARVVRNIGADNPLLTLIGASMSTIATQFGSPEEVAIVPPGGQSPQFRLRNSRGQEARLRVLCDSLLVCEGVAIDWDRRNWARSFAR